MAEDSATTLFFELFSGLPRQGPGSDASTLRALAMVPGIGAQTQILDLGCGTGAQTLVLARHTPAHIVAIDNHRPFIAELNRRAREMDIDRMEARVADMQRLDFPPQSFDLIWAEGSIYVVGFENGLKEWRRLLRPGGHVALTEVCWTRPDPPPECAAFWAQEYPAIGPVSARLAAIADCGYETVAHFPLPPSAWWDEYYGPLQQNIVGFRERHRTQEDAQQIADQAQREIDMWRAYSEFYHYEFLVLRI